MIKQYELGAPAFEFLKSRLRAGDALASLLLDLPIDAGRIVVHLPDCVDLQQVDLKDGGLSRYWRAGDECDAPLTSLVLGHLARFPRNALVLENWSCRLGEPINAPGGLSFFTFAPSRYRICKGPSDPGEETIAVFTFLAGGHATADQISLGFRKARHYPSVSVLTALPEPAERIAGTAVDSATLRRLAEATTGILVGAYDEDATLVWERGPA